MLKQNPQGGCKKCYVTKALECSWSWLLVGHVQAHNEIMRLIMV